MAAAIVARTNGVEKVAADILRWQRVLDAAERKLADDPDVRRPDRK